MYAHIYSIIFTCAEFEHSHSQYSVMQEALAVSVKCMIRVYMHAHNYMAILIHFIFHYHYTVDNIYRGFSDLTYLET